jgi:hypothetical protein
MIASILTFENVRETVPLRLRLGTKLSSKARAGEDNRKASMKGKVGLSEGEGQRVTLQEMQPLRGEDNCP